MGTRALSGTRSFAAANNTHFNNDGIHALIDSTKMAYKGPFSAESIGIPHKRRLIDRDEHDSLENASLSLENSRFLKTLDQIIQSGGIQRGVPPHMARPNPDTPHLSLQVKSTTNNISNTQDVLQADDPKHRNGKAELLPYTESESKRQGMNDNGNISPLMSVLGDSDTKMNLKWSLEGPVENGCRLYELKVRPLQPCKYCKEPGRNEQQYPRSHGDPYIIESCEHNSLLGNMKIIASRSVCVKCLTNDLHPVSRRKNNEEHNNAHDKNDKLLYGKDNVLSYHHLYDSIPQENSRQSLGSKSSPLLTEVAQQDGIVQPRVRKETLGSTLSPAYLVEKSDLVLGDSETRAREELDCVPHTNNFYSTTKSVNEMKLPWPVDDAWPQDHAKCLIRNKACFHPSTSKMPAWLEHQTGFSDVDQGNKSPIDNFTRVIRQNKPLENDGILQDRKLERRANAIATQDHMTDDDEAWLKRARRIVLESLKARSNNIMGDSYRTMEQDAPMQLENQVQSSQLQVLGKRSRLADSDLSTKNNNAKPRGSVWSRLSFTRKTSNPVQVILPNAEMNEH